MRFIVKNFHELSTTQLYQILQIRAEVFIVEQHCAYQDIDGYDAIATHIFAQNNHTIIAYGRILPPKSKYEEVSLGRILTSPKERAKSVGKPLVSTLIQEAHKQFPNQVIKISAQQYLEKFYQNFGFKTTSDSYLEDDIPHIEMKLII